MADPRRPVIYIDADACPVKEETYRVAKRYALRVVVASNRSIHTPLDPTVSLRVIPGSFDAVDDWIASEVARGDLVVTGDIPLAARCLEKGARVLGTRGEEFTPDGIGDALASRALSDHLRQMGAITGGPAPMDKKFRSRFLGKLDEMVNALLREAAG